MSTRSRSRHCEWCSLPSAKSSLKSFLLLDTQVPRPPCPANLGPDAQPPRVGAISLTDITTYAGFGHSVDGSVLPCFDGPERHLRALCVEWEVPVRKRERASRVAKRAVSKAVRGSRRKTVSRKADFKSSGWYEKAARSISAASNRA